MATAAQYDIFVSYPRKDSANVRPIVQALRARGLRVFVDEEQVPTFESITRTIEAGLKCSKALLAYYSADYAQSRACQWELSAAYLAAQRQGDPTQRILVINPSESRRHLHPVSLQQALFASPPDHDDGAALRDLAERIAARVKALADPLGALKPARPVPWRGARALGSERFVGRLAEMWELHTALTVSAPLVAPGPAGPPVAVVQGLGGMGKTFVAQEYAVRFEAAYPGGVFLLRALGSDERGSLLSAEALEAERVRQMTALAVSCGILEEGRSAAQLEAAFTDLLAKHGEPYLWIVDDLPAGLDAATFGRWLAPHALGRSLITTRSREYDALGTGVEIGVLPKDEALALLTTARPPQGTAEQEAADGVAAELGFLALALAVAGAAVAEAPSGYAGYLKDLRDPHSDELELAARLKGVLPTGHEKSIAVTLWRSISRVGEDAQDFLRLASVLGAAPIPSRLFAGCLATEHGVSARTSEQRARFALDETDALCLSDRVDLEPPARTVHALVRRTLAFHHTGQQRRERLRDIAVNALLDAVTPTTDIRSHHGLRHEIAHARELSASAATDGLATLMGWVAHHDSMQGHYGSAAELYRRQLSARRRLLGDRDQGTAQSLGNLATTLQKLGDLPGARALFEEGLEALRASAGSQPEATIVTMNNLAGVLGEQGELGAALALQASAVSAAMSGLGEEHPTTLVVRASLANGLFASGRLDEARAQYETLLPLMQQGLDPEHASLLTCRMNLALIWQQQGYLADAAPVLCEVLATRSRVLPEDHPSTLVALAALSTQRNLEGAFEEAATLGRDLVARRKRVLGDRHPDTLRALSSLVAPLCALGDLGAAYPIAVEAVDGLTRTLGEESPPTLKARAQLAGVLFTQRRLPEARTTLGAVLAASRRVLGDSHPDTLSSMNALATVCSQLDMHEQAEPLFREAIAGLTAVLGADHRETQVTTENLAVDLRAQGKLIASRALLESTLERWRRTRGEENADTLRASWLLAQVLEDLGEIERAFHLVNAISGVRAKVFGPDDERTIDSLVALGRLLYAGNNAAQAKTVLIAAINCRAKRFGERDVHVLDAVRLYSCVLFTLGERDEALRLLDMTRQTAVETWGPDHPLVPACEALVHQIQAAARRAGPSSD